jgi:hypothetical protein
MLMLSCTHRLTASVGSAPAAPSSCPASTPDPCMAPLPQGRSPTQSPSPWKDSRRAPGLQWATTGPARTSLYIIAYPSQPHIQPSRHRVSEGGFTVIARSYGETYWGR